MNRSGLPRLILAIAVLAPPLLAQSPSDLQVQLRSATGSTRFQIGEVIPLEVVLSSGTPNRYLEPCSLFRESNFGFPQCRFFSRWSFTISPDAGWVDITKEFPSGPSTHGGPMFEVPYRDLSIDPQVFSYTLTHRFRFDQPGEYRVELSLDVGLDDETTRRKPAGDALSATDPDSALKPHSVTVKPAILLQIVAASAGWQKEIIRNGSEAYSRPIPPRSNPPSPESLRYQQATEALCNLGTADAARALADLLSPRHQEIQSCLERTPSPEAAIKAMQRLLGDPEVAVNPELFSELVRLQGRAEFKTEGTYIISQPAVDREREMLISALPHKRAEAYTTSLLTVLLWPPRAESTPFYSGYDLPFDPAVIAAVVANFDVFPWDQQEWLLADAWPRVDSPLMLPLVRRLAEAGNGQALLRWMELDPTAAAEFARKEVVRAVPRFSSFYLRLPEPSLPNQEAQLAANFVMLTRDQDLFRAATLLHRYATASVLPEVLPFIDAKRAAWPCSVQYPVLAYLLKVSPAAAEPRLKQVLQEVNHQPWQPTFFSDIGFLEPSPVLERLALAQIDAGTQPLARDAIEYLRLHGSAAAKPLLWNQLVRWHQKLQASRAAKSAKEAEPVKEKAMLVTELTEAFTRARAWVLSPQDTTKLRALLGEQTASELICRFNCGASLAAGRGSYDIYGQANSHEPEPHPEYMNPTERLQYVINQYRCPDMRALKQKILQFPAGSSFGFAYNFTARDRDELVEINDFLWTHGYKVRNPQNWDFLQPLPDSKSAVPPASPTLDNTDASERKRTWGPLQQGLRADLTLDKLSYPVGKDVPLHIAVESVSAPQPVYGEPIRPRPAFEGYSSSSISVVVQDEDGPLTPQLDSSGVETFGGPLLCPPPYPQGTPVQVEKSLRQLGLLPSKPGNYKISVTWSPYTTHFSNCEAVPHLEPGAPAEKPFVSVNSNPVFLQITGESSPAEPEYSEWKERFSLTDTSFGEKTALLDNATQLAWLRLSLTRGLSYDQVRAQLAAGGRFAGWRFATVAELRLFFANFTGSPSGHSTDPSIERKLQRLLGGPLNEVSNRETGWYRRDSSGFAGDPAGPDNEMIHYHAGYLTEDSDRIVIDPESGGSLRTGVADSGWGSFLVRPQ